MAAILVGTGLADVRSVRSSLGFLVIAISAIGCAGMPEPTDPPLINSIDPAIGSVEGGTRVTIRGASFAHDSHVTIGGVACTDVKRDGTDRISCKTGSTDLVEGALDVVVTTPAGQATLPAGYTYQCPWTTRAMRRSCGAVPPGHAPEQVVASWITQFQGDDGFYPDAGGTTDMADTGDFTLGTQSAWVATAGNGIPRTIARAGGPALDFTGAMFKIWLKVDNIAHASALDVVLGDAGFANQFVFQLRSGQGQQWITEGDWVAFTVAWSPESYRVIGNPDRGAITDVMIRIADDASGAPVRLHVNGLALVDEPAQRFPEGVVSFTFDDNFATVTDGAAILERYGFPATAYVIMDTVDRHDRMTLADLQHLADAGWDISVHANTDLHHLAHYTALSPATVEDDMVDARAWLIKNRFKGYDHCAYPSGEFSGAILEAANLYFTSCRTIFTRQRETFPPSDPVKLRVFYVPSATPLAAVEQAVDNARANREWLILVFHRIVTTPTLTTEWRAADLDALAQYVASSGMPVQPVSNVLAM